MRLPGAGGMIDIIPYPG